MGIAAGITCILNGFSITATSLSFQPTSGTTNFIGGIILIVIGLVMWLLVREGVVFARLGLTSGLAIFFFGNHIVNTYKTSLGLGIGWLVMLLGIALLVIGFRHAPFTPE